MSRRVTVLILIVAMLMVPALAAWSDVYVIVSGTLASMASGWLPLSMISSPLYATQQDAQAAIDSMTGTSMDTYYVWVCVSDSCVPVDPYNVGN